MTRPVGRGATRGEWFIVLFAVLLAWPGRLSGQITLEGFVGSRRFIAAPSGSSDGIKLTFRPVELVEYGAAISLPLGPVRSGLWLSVFDAAYGGVGDRVILAYRDQYVGFSLGFSSSWRVAGGGTGVPELRLLGVLGSEWLQLADEERDRREMTARVGPQLVAKLGSSVGMSFTPELGVALGRFVEDSELPQGFTNPKPVWLGFRVGLLWTP